MEYLLNFNELSYVNEREDLIKIGEYGDGIYIDLNTPFSFLFMLPALLFMTYINARLPYLTFEENELVFWYCTHKIQGVYTKKWSIKIDEVVHIEMKNKFRGGFADTRVYSTYLFECANGHEYKIRLWRIDAVNFYKKIKTQTHKIYPKK